MNRLIASTLVGLALLSPSHVEARFTQSDTWQGIKKQPVTLNKYAYANIDPVNHIDPTGHFSMVEFGATNNINSILLKTTTAAVGVSLLMVGMSNTMTNSPRGRKWSIWDIVATNHFKSHVSSGTQIATGTQTKKRKRNPNDGHHTIPIYLCGSAAQQLSSIERGRHRAIHTGLATVEVALIAAEQAADRFVPLTRRRSLPILSLAETREGRGVISGAIQGFYQSAGFWGDGNPSIASIFPSERQQFIAGKTSLPNCKRGG